MEIVKKLIKFNFTPNSNNPKYLVIHDTGNRASGSNAEMHYRYFNGGDRQASAHFFVDDKQILQTVEVKDKSWHCGDGQGKNGIDNANSIGIEICINSDGNYDLAVLNTIELAANLMEQYKIPLSNMVTHNTVSGKNCPQSMNNNGDWSKWNQFKQTVADKLYFNKVVNNQYLVNSPSYWNLRCKSKMFVQGDYARQLIVKYVAMFKLCNTFEEVMNHMAAMGIVKSPTYWIDNAVVGGKVRGDFMKLLIINMGSKL